MSTKYFSKRLNDFGEQEKDIVDLGAELYRHYRFETTKDSRIKDKLRQFSVDGTLEDKQAEFTKRLLELSSKYAGLPAGHQFNEFSLRTHPNVKWATFSVLSEILDVVVPETVLDNMYQFADVKTFGWGDNMVFNVPNSDVFVVSTSANGVRKSGLKQRLLGTDIILNPIEHQVTIAEDWYKIVSGKVNWGDWVTRVVQGIETQITTDVYNAIINSYSNLTTSYQETGAFVQDKFNKLTNRVTAANRGKASAFGTKVALSKIVPADQYFRFGLGEEYNSMGYLTNYQGTDLFQLDQRLIPNTDTFAIDDATVLILSSGLSKIVKIGFEGNTEVIQSEPNQNADRSVDQTVKMRWDVKIAASQKYGMWNVIS